MAECYENPECPAKTWSDVSEAGTLGDIASGKYLRITSFRRDGSGVDTPVWFVPENGRLLVQTDADSYKVKRIRRNPSVLIAPCNARGRQRGGQVPARAEVLPDSETGRVEELLARKYRADMLMLKPIRAVQKTLHLGGPRGKAVIVAISLPDAPAPNH
jgi:PPOX class probable F420-dependent enzyme